MLLPGAAICAHKCTPDSELDCIPDSDRGKCESFVTNWGSGSSDGAVRVVASTPVFRGSVLADAIVYGCYSKRSYDERGFSEDSEKFMLLLKNPPSEYTESSGWIPLFPAGNPTWKKSEDLIHFRILGVREFAGADPSHPQASPILFLQKTTTGENPCCDGGDPRPRGQSLIGYLIQPGTATVVFNQTIEQTSSTVDDTGTGEFAILTSTVIYAEMENRLSLESSINKKDYVSPDVLPGQPPATPNLIKESHEVVMRTFHWTGANFEESRGAQIGISTSGVRGN